MGSAVRMGAGFFPYILTGILILLGLAIIVSALRSGEVTSPRLAWRPLLIIPAAVALFAVLINMAGLVLTSLAIVILSRLARAGNPWGETLVLAIGAAIVTAGLFHYGLGLNLPLWPQLG